MLVRHSAPDLIVKLLVCQGLGGLETLIRQSRPVEDFISIQPSKISTEQHTSIEQHRLMQGNES